VALHSAHSRTISERVYQMLLLCYPRTFRHEYGEEMLRTFRDCYRETRNDWSGLLHLWGLVASDLLITACSEHYRAWFARFRRWTGTEKEFFAMSAFLQLTIASRTDKGQKRPSNEDHVASTEPQDQQIREQKGVLFVVSDGMGGHSRGELASQITTEEVTKSYYASTSADITIALADAVKQANRAVYQENQMLSNQPDKHGMGSTCIAAVVQGDQLYIANVGDSRAYLAHQGQLRQLTQDHSIVARMVREGQITAEAAFTHPDRNIIYRSIGETLDVEVDTFVESVQTGDILLLCTDGLLNDGLIGETEALSIIERYTPTESTERLIALINERGAPDNISVIIAEIRGA
jgi:serine/threonine protein phosphatase PrpC